MMTERQHCPVAAILLRWRSGPLPDRARGTFTAAPVKSLASDASEPPFGASVKDTGRSFSRPHTANLVRECLRFRAGQRADVDAWRSKRPGRIRRHPVADVRQIWSKR